MGFNLLHLVIKKAEGLESQDRFGNNDAFIKVKFDADSDEVWPHKAKTQVIDDSNDPVWNEEFFFVVKNEVELVRMNLKDEDKTGSDSIDEFRLRLRGTGPNAVDYSGGLIHEVCDVEGGGQLHFAHYLQPLSAIANSQSASSLAKLKTAELTSLLDANNAEIGQLEAAAAVDAEEDAIAEAQMAAMSSQHDEHTAAQAAEMELFQTQIAQATEGAEAASEAVTTLEASVAAKSSECDAIQEQLDASVANCQALEQQLAEENADDDIAQALIAQIQAMGIHNEGDEAAKEAAFEAQIAELKAQIEAKDAEIAQEMAQQGPPEPVDISADCAEHFHFKGGEWKQIHKSSHELERKPQSVSLSVKWRDQGWGNRKGRVAVKLFRAEEEVASWQPFGIAPHKFAVVTGATTEEAVVTAAEAGDHYELWASVSDSGGHQLLLSDIRAVANF